MCGAGAPSIPDEQTRIICDLAQPHVQAYLSGIVTFSEFEPVEVLRQVVAGTMWYVRVNAGQECVDIKVFEGLPHTGSQLTLLGIKMVEATDHLAIFDSTLDEPIDLSATQEEVASDPVDLLGLRLNEIMEQQELLAAERLVLEAQITQLNKAPKKKLKDTIRLNVRKSDHYSYMFDVDPNITISDLKALVIDAIADQMMSKGAVDNRKPFDERQMDIFSPETCKVLFMTKKLNQLGLKDGDQLFFNIRQWTGGRGRY